MTPARRWFPLSGPVAAEGRGAVARERARAAGPVDPLTGPALALRGRVVTMDDAFTVHDRAVVFVDKGRIVAVRRNGEAPPPGFEAVPVVETGGTLYPGLIELHNHLSYNALPLWSVPRLFQHRGQWPNHADYRPLISGPMTVIGEHRGADGNASLLPALCRYVECKCLMGGVTTSQGVKLASNAGIQRFYRGIVRNVEQTDDAELPEAQARIPDFVAGDAAGFLARLKREDSCFLLHLSEGITPAGDPDSMARKHFRALQVSETEWALNQTFAGIHAAGLLPGDFQVLARHKSSMVWSPLSNLLLYGDTARVKDAKEAGITIGLGSDWSPTGSKNLLGEMKAAWLYDRHVLGGLFGARGIVAMATRDAARILKWDKAAGGIVAGRRADLLVVAGAAGDPYESLVRARETDVHLVAINGIARYGTSELMTALGPKGEAVRVGGQARRIFLGQSVTDEAVKPVSLKTAARTLRDALRHIDRLAREAERPRPERARRRALDAPVEPQWTLALDEIKETGVEIRPRLPLDGPRDFTGPEVVPKRAAAARAVPLSQVVKPVKLDPLTVADDADFLDQIEAQPNLPDAIRRNLRALY